MDELPGKVNYFLGNDPTKWRTNIPTYAKVKYEGVYPGVDLVYFGNGRELEYDFVVTPGISPKVITLEIGGLVEGDGHPPLRIDAAGNLILRTAGGEVTQRAPAIYQDINGARHPISGGYLLRDLETTHDLPPTSHHIGFWMGEYDNTKLLIIDPVLVYSTYLGASGDEQALGIAVDVSGNAYVTGFTSSTNFPVVTPIQQANAGAQDVFVVKLDRTGTDLIYATYFGGNNSDVGRGIAVGASGNVYITGETGSTDFPTTAGASQPVSGGGVYDAFVIKLNTAGSALLYSTFLGGSANDVGRVITVDASDSAYVTGRTSSTNFPRAGLIQSTYGGDPWDAFVTKLNATGSNLVYSTYLGGSGDDGAYGIAVDTVGNTYLAGYTNSTNFPTTPGAFQRGNAGLYDGFVAKVNSTGSALVYSTYLGGSGHDWSLGGFVDASGSAYVTGATHSTDFPIASAFQPTNGGSQDAFVTKLNAAGAALLYSTYLGGSGDEQGFAIAVDACGNAHVTGHTSSTNFPMARSVQPTYGGGPRDAFVTRLNATGSALGYSTYLGGSGYDSSGDYAAARFGGGIAVDTSGGAYVAGFTDSTNFPTANPLQSAFGGVRDSFVAKIRDPLAPADRDVNQDGIVGLADLQIVVANFGPPPINTPRANIRRDAVVDVLDLALVARSLGELVGCD